MYSVQCSDLFVFTVELEEIIQSKMVMPSGWLLAAATFHTIHSDQ